jgi:hypothetical protein
LTSLINQLLCPFFIRLGRHIPSIPKMFLGGSMGDKG